MSRPGIVLIIGVFVLGLSTLYMRAYGPFYIKNITSLSVTNILTVINEKDLPFSTTVLCNYGPTTVFYAESKTIVDNIANPKTSFVLASDGAILTNPEGKRYLLLKSDLPDQNKVRVLNGVGVVSQVQSVCKAVD
jgi:hypothetical protein